MKMILQPFGEHTLGELLNSALSSEIGAYHSFQAAVAFAKRSGVQHIRDAVQEFVRRGGDVRMVIGVDHYGTSAEGLLDLLTAIGDGGELWIYHDEDRYISFHPKVYLFEGEGSALLIVGSGNLTQGGLYANAEVSSVIRLDLDNVEDRAVLEETKAVLDSWCNEEQETVNRLNAEFLRSLVDEGYVRSEVQSRAEDEAEEKAGLVQRDDSDEILVRRTPLFGRSARRWQPPRRRRAPSEEAQVVETFERPELPPSVRVPIADWFAITVLYGDLPQLGSSNEIRITKGIRDKNRSFWGWPDAFDGPDEKTGQYHRNIRIRFQDQIIEGYLKDFPPQKPDGTKASADFRLGSIAPIVQGLQEEDDMVILETTDEENVDFVAHVVPKANREVYEELADGLIQYTRARSPITSTYKKYKYESGKD
jgi:HKD family nuclease